MKTYNLERINSLPPIESIYPDLAVERGFSSTTEAGEDDVSPRVIYWYHPDYVGNVDLVTDVNQQAHEMFLYNPWGENLYHWESGSSNWSSPYRFNSKELDSETGMHYYGARYHNPKLSVWMSVDPLVHKTMEAYIFSGNSPINYIDPSGKEKREVIHYLDNDGNIINTVIIVTQGVYKYDMQTYGAYEDNYRPAAYDIEEVSTVQPNGDRKVIKTRNPLSQDSFFNAIWSDFSDWVTSDGGVRIDIYGAGGHFNENTWTSGSLGEVIGTVDMQDPYWEAVFGAFQKEKFIDAIKGLSDIERFAEGFKRLLEVIEASTNVEIRADIEDNPLDDSENTPPTYKDPSGREYMECPLDFCTGHFIYTDNYERVPEDKLTHLDDE